MNLVVEICWFFRGFVLSFLIGCNVWLIRDELRKREEPYPNVFFNYRSSGKKLKLPTNDKNRKKPEDKPLKKTIDEDEGKPEGIPFFGNDAPSDEDDSSNKEGDEE